MKGVVATGVVDTMRIREPHVLLDPAMGPPHDALASRWVWWV